MVIGERQQLVHCRARELGDTRAGASALTPCGKQPRPPLDGDGAGDGAADAAPVGGGRGRHSAPAKLCMTAVKARTHCAAPASVTW
mmetsp:Transcript_1844/g.6598  ORF Transcript_1844/g.6598 Transcript_1844/m.6598 type:complete len:86 (-) Transcript_1844:227-484(-)